MNITTKQFIDMLRELLTDYDRLLTKIKSPTESLTEEEWRDFHEIQNLVERFCDINQH